MKARFLWSPFRRAIASVALAAPLCVVAMFAYPGGTHLERGRQHYSLTQNFFSDLGMTVAYNGRPNRVGATLFVVCLLLLVIGLGGALIGFVRRYAGVPAARRFAQAGALAGLVVCLSFAGVAATPEDRLFDAHLTLTLTAFRVFPIVTALLAIAATLAGERAGITSAWLLLTAALIAYLGTFSFGPPGTTLPGRAFHVIAQKAIAIVAIGTLVYLCSVTERLTREAA